MTQKNNTKAGRGSAKNQYVSAFTVPVLGGWLHVEKLVTRKKIEVKRLFVSGVDDKQVRFPHLTNKGGSAAAVKHNFMIVDSDDLTTESLAARLHRRGAGWCAAVYRGADDLAVVTAAVEKAAASHAKAWLRKKLVAMGISSVEFSRASGADDLAALQLLAGAPAKIDKSGNKIAGSIGEIEAVFRFFFLDCLARNSKSDFPAIAYHIKQGGAVCIGSEVLTMAWRQADNVVRRWASVELLQCGLGDDGEEIDQFPDQNHSAASAALSDATKARRSAIRAAARAMHAAAREAVLRSSKSEKEKTRLLTVDTQFFAAAVAVSCGKPIPDWYRAKYTSTGSAARMFVMRLRERVAIGLKFLNDADSLIARNSLADWCQEIGVKNPDPVKARIDDFCRWAAEKEQDSRAVNHLAAVLRMIRQESSLKRKSEPVGFSAAPAFEGLSVRLARQIVRVSHVVTHAKQGGGSLDLDLWQRVKRDEAQALINPWH